VRRQHLSIAQSSTSAAAKFAGQIRQKIFAANLRLMKGPLSSALVGASHPQVLRRRAMTIDFGKINGAALAALPVLLQRWLPDGRRRGREYVARNPTRNDGHLGSFCINIATGRWADFADGAKGGDVISLFAYLRGIRQADAARELALLLQVRT
jgi:hypothetical protein